MQHTENKGAAHSWKELNTTDAGEIAPGTSKIFFLEFLEETMNLIGSGILKSQLWKYYIISCCYKIVKYVAFVYTDISRIYY